ncbi:transcription intermediary factor 1-beta [Zonotrichia leucophrys gambelii]|uniref:transcription intermediary factor 1-beta n=1 Tax=Zonotrichia leucophrys gambelii TaxID=257770 RepID=UPI00313FE28C
MAAPEVAAALGSGPGASGAELPEPLGLLELCGACRQRLSPQRKPRLLPCLHSVCRGCIGSEHGDKNAFECPVCHQQCPLGDIMDNLFLQPIASSQSCTSCEDNASATSFCLECSEPLCETCVGAHLRVRYTREHRVEPLSSPSDPSDPVDPMDPNDPIDPGDPAPALSWCRSHPRQPLSLFCSSCESLTCGECHRREHRHHPGSATGGSTGTTRAIVSEPPLPPSRSPAHGPSPTKQAVPAPPELLLQGPPRLSPPPQVSPPPRMSPPPLEPAATPSPQRASSPENGATAGSARLPGRSPREEKLVKKLLIKRRGPPSVWGSPPRLPKQPRVSLERLELDLELDPAQPPVFRIFPGPSAHEFSLIVIEQGTPGTPGTPGTDGNEGTPGTEGTAGTVQPHGALLVKEEQQESPIGDTGDIGDTKPVGLLPPALGDPGPVPGVPGGVPVGVPVGVPGGVPGVSCCRVCGQAGAVVMCDRCQRCFHLHCHLPALHDVPSPEWTCLLCQELPPPVPEPEPDPEQGPPVKLSPQDQQRCEFVLLELLCHEPCRPLQRLCSSTDGAGAMDLTLMRARLQEKLSPAYRSPQEFARDGWALLRQFHRLTEDKADVQSILELQRFLERRLSAAFGDQKFSRMLLEPEESLEGPAGT